MITGHLVLTALDMQDTLSVVLAALVPGEPPALAEANAAFHRLTSFTPEQLGGGLLTSLSAPPPYAPGWTSLLSAISAGQTQRGEIACLKANGEPFWFGYALSHARDPLSGRTHPVLTGRDITHDRRTRQEEASSQALLAMMFMKTDVAVVLVAQDGRVSMANPAMAELTGYSTAELIGKPVRELTHPGDVAQAAAAHARQLAGGGTYRMRLRCISKDGRISVTRLTSTLIERSKFELFRVVTLMVDPGLDALPGSHADKAATPNSPAAPGSSTGQTETTAALGRVETLSLAAIRAICGDTWEHVADRILMLAESIIKRRLEPQDVFARSDTSGFVIWFAKSDEAVAGARLAAIAREIRISLLGAFGQGGLGEITAVSAFVTLDEPATLPAARLLPKLDARLREKENNIRAQALDYVMQVSANPPVEATRVTDRQDKRAGLIWADLPRAVRTRLDTACASLPEEMLDDAGIAARPELLRLCLAVSGAGKDQIQGRPGVWMVPISCAALLSATRRQVLLDALRGTPEPVRARLVGLIADIQADLSEAKIRGWFELLGPWFHSVGVLAHAPELPHRFSLQKSCALMAIDLDAGKAPSEEAAFELIGHARGKGLPVLVRTSQPAALTTWRELGATLFAHTRDAASGP